jgi:uncharacterized tellurite resistance protein B-like protein
MTAADRAQALCDLLLAAAYADAHFHEREKALIRERVAELSGGEVPAELAARIDAFDPAGFDLEETAAAFAGDPPEKKRELLELVAALHEADEELDLAEDDYLRALARGIGAPDGALDGLVLSYEVEALRRSFEGLRATPPPIPKR